MMIAEGNNNISDLTDENLVEFYIAENKEDFFEEIFNRYSNRIYAIAFRITRDHHKSEEVFQEVFFILARKINTFRGDSKFSTWLYRIAVNASFGHLRAEKKHDNDISLENHAPYDISGSFGDKVESKEWGSSPYLVLYKKEAMDQIEKAIKELPEKYRIVFDLKDIEQLSNGQISEILGITLCTTKSRLHRARLFVRDKISDYFYEWNN
ncbi:MAG: sigma-70 family RNA polymerase sigma factor [Candidatus Dadabacteria bacterium]|nr:sigma-70 family RNA polymerase sigma factor [Candidatus Dadabacteria bacterium]